MSDQIIVDNCAPTLAGLKTGNLFSVRLDGDGGRKNLYRDLRELNRRLTKKRLRAVPLRVRESFALIYVYRPDSLMRDVSRRETEQLLRELGYTAGDADCMVTELARRLSGSAGVPHEIGLFLGYPPEDVRGFMRDPLHGFKYIGYWKVYGDVERAKKIFDGYTRCTDVYRRCLTMGTPLDRLIVGRA